MNARFRWAALGSLLALRLPSLVQPTGPDQSLYGYIGARILAGEVPYIDAWDQNPPGIHLLYALLWWLWPDERVVAAADLAAAGATCALLVVLGTRMTTAAAGWLSACLLALLANPSLQPLSGVLVRAQPETFVALAATASLVLVVARRQRPLSGLGAGALLGVAVSLDYTAVVFALPLTMAVWRRRPADGTPHGLRASLVHITGGAGAVATALMIWLASRGALQEWWIATLGDNVRYPMAGDGSPLAAALDALATVVRQPQRDLLWFLGLAGLAIGARFQQARHALLLAGSWIGAAIFAISLNGRGLPQDFVQAAPPLALAAATAMAAVWRSQGAMRVLVTGLLVVGVFRLGADAPFFGVARLANMPRLVDNMRSDVAYWRGRIDQRTYLNRFGGQGDPYSARDIEEAARLVQLRSAPGDTILVFGLSPGVYVKTGRKSASRFFWSLPVRVEFERGRRGYGSEGLLEELQAANPAVVVLEKGDGQPDSLTFFTGHPALSAWLAAGYRPTGESRRYATWRRTEVRLP